jgi:tRNA-dihydrouridine synthase
LVENITFKYPLKQPEIRLIVRDEVLLDNQRLLFNQLNSLKESLKVLSQKEKKPIADTSAVLSAEVAELKRLNASLLLNQQEMVKEMQQMKMQMGLMTQYMHKNEDESESVKAPEDDDKIIETKIEELEEEESSIVDWWNSPYY